uniref:Uncharacterized protein n=1 Tax=Strigamia maritima TaxID=126957 RepID=T1JI40_STRMM
MLRNFMFINPMENLSRKPQIHPQKENLDSFFMLDKRDESVSDEPHKMAKSTRSQFPFFFLICRFKNHDVSFVIINKEIPEYTLKMVRLCFFSCRIRVEYPSAGESNYHKSSWHNF